MQFGTTQRRTFWRDITVGLAVDLILAWVIALFWGRGEIVLATVITYIALQVIYLVMWGRRTAGMWIWFWLGGRKRQSEHIADFLRERGFPKPGSFYSSAESYLEQVVTDESLKPNLRIAAAAELASLNAIAQIGHIQRRMLLTFAYEDAIKIYGRTFPVTSIDDQDE
jgi:hypothetical protein